MKKCFYLILIFLIIISCFKNKSQEKTISEETKDIMSEESDILEDENGVEMISEEKIKSIIKKMGNTDLKIKSKKIKEPKYNINSSYLNEKLEFKSLNAKEFKNNNIGVIGTNGVKLYSDMKSSKEICEIPKGTIIPLLKEYKNSEIKKDEYDPDFYQFKNEYNYWYETSYQNKKGFVFGSYIVREGDSLKNITKYGWFMDRSNKDSDWNILVRLAEYYKKEVKSDNFYDFNGFCKIPEKIQNCLTKDKIVLEKINYKDYINELNIENPDDMIVLYKMLHSDKMATTFITTDFLVHNLHLLFDRMLQDTEQSILYPLLKVLVKRYYNTLEEYEKNISNDETVLKESIEIMKKYFIVSADILGVELINKDNYPSDVKKELELISKAEGFVDKAPIFQYKEDYSQFKPRGHYTKNDILKKYFKAMMWFGRLHFYCVKNRSKKENDAALRLTPAALLLTKIAKEDKDIFALWKAVFMPISYIVGNSDDYNLIQYISVSDKVDFTNFGKWVQKKNNILNFIEMANKEIDPPKISGNTLMQNKETSDNFPSVPAGFRLFGQRFTFDSFIHNMLSSPRVGPPLRNMVKGIDIMAVFGNKLADEMLSDDKKTFGKFENNINILKKELNGFNDDDWRKTFYNSYLRIIKESACFDNTMGFYFTQSNAWNKKALLTSHGSWAELRHDTILYVKQSYAEKAGKGPEMTWVLDEIERPIGFVEPNLGALYWLSSILDDSTELLVKNGFMTEKYEEKFNDYKDIIDKIVAIAELESNDKQISKEQNEFIYSLPYKLSSIILPVSSMDLIEQKDLQMALVADVHTDSEAGEVLEIATGIPYRIYVALNDGHGGKRIAEGYTYSYYEFPHPMNDRLNDDQWKEKVYGGDPKFVESKIPEWLKDIICK